MTSEEFQMWLRHHQSCFVGIGRWLSSFPEAGGEVNRPDVLRRWYGALRDVELDDAVAASDAMLAGDLPEPRSFDRHVTAVRQQAIAIRNNQQREYRPRYDGEQTVNCSLCQDDGWVTIWDSIAVAAAQRGRLGERGTLSVAAVACNCQAGRKHDKCRPPVFNEMKMLPVRCKHDPREQDALVEFVARSMEWKPAMSYEEVCGVGS